MPERILLRVIDFESSDLPPEGRVVEMGWCDVSGVLDGSGGMRWTVGAPHSRLVNPGRPINPVAMAIHGIEDGDVSAAPPFIELAPLLMEGTPRALVAHNAAFERQFFTTPATWLDTWKMALHLAPNAPRWSNGVLRYWLKLDLDRTLAEPMHRAGPDAYVTAHLLVRMLAKISLEEAAAVSNRPALLPRLHFGEHSGKPASEVPESYWHWIVHKSKGPWDEDTLYTARHYLELRKDANRARDPVRP